MNAEAVEVVTETCAVVSFSCGFVISSVFFWLYMIHSAQKQ